MINELFVLLQLLSPYGVTEENEIEPFLRSSPEVRFLEYSDYQTLLGLNEKETELVDQLDAFDKVWYFYSCYEAKMSANDNFPANLISNKEGDAFRHTYWSALLCEHIDVETVLSLTYAHEYGTEGALDSQMDLHNDLNGTLLYLEYTQELNEVNDLDNFIIENEYDVRCFGFDPYNAKDFVERWEKENGPFGIEKVIQGAKTESVPLGELKKLAEDRMLIFDESIMEYCMGNAITLEDTNGNRKLFKKRYDQKIDSVASMMDAYIAWKLNREAFE